MDEEHRRRAKELTKRLFAGVKTDAGYDFWKRFDPELARELAVFLFGGLYARDVISQRDREMCAVASLTVLDRPRELYAHIHAALNVGVTRRELAEVILQQVTYGGMPVVIEGLRVFAQVLTERNEHFPGEESES